MQSYTVNYLDRKEGTFDSSVVSAERAMTSTSPQGPQTANQGQQLSAQWRHMCKFDKHCQRTQAYIWQTSPHG